MESLVIFLRYEVWLLVAVLFFVVGYRILTGQINTRGLMASKGNQEGFSPARVQLFVLTLAGVVGYLTRLFDNSTRLPDIPQDLIAAMGASNLFYVASKARSWLFPRNASQNPEKGGA